VSAAQDVEGRSAAVELDPEEFRRLGYATVDAIAEFLRTIDERPVTPGESPTQIRRALGGDGVPEHGTPPEVALADAVRLVFEHSAFNGHPRFFGYITSSAAPIGALGDLLGAAANPNVGGFPLAPLATELEAQTIRWIAELLGYPADCGGLLVSGGNMANFVGLLAARAARAPWPVRTEGLAAAGAPPLRVYCSAETHTWVQKAADLFGLGTDAVRWIETDDEQRLLVPALRERIVADRAEGALPFLVVGTAGSVSTGAVDPLDELAEVCRSEELWFHVDGAYGAPAVLAPDAPPALAALGRADSVAIDPHKWLYAPLEAGCVLVRNRERLRGAFTYRRLTTASTRARTRRSSTSTSAPRTPAGSGRSRSGSSCGRPAARGSRRRSPTTSGSRGSSTGSRTGTPSWKPGRRASASRPSASSRRDPGQARATARPT
jgi:aromatic-L-amino-acid/L-tryptophan decarboxylase